jgi:hypothetical protein
MNYTQQGGGTEIKFYKQIINSTSVIALRSNPVNLISGIPFLTYGLIPVVCIFALDVTVSTTFPLLIGNAQLCSNYVNQEIGVWNSFNMQGSENGGLAMNFILQQANNKDVQLSNALRDYNPTLTSAPGTNTFQLFQTNNDPSADYGGIFSMWYIDAPLY